MLYETVLLLLLSFKPWYQDIDEPKEARIERFDVVARAQVEVGAQLTCSGAFESEGCARAFPGTQGELIALLMTAGWWESRYNRRIHAGECASDECDGGASRSVYQVQNNGTYPEELWENSVGLDYESTLNATRAAALSFSAAWRVCHKKHGTKGVWAAYGRGHCTASFPGQISRNRWYQRRLRQLRAR